MLNYQIFDTTGVSNMTLRGGTMGTLCFRGFLELEMEWNMTTNDAPYSSCWKSST